MPDSNFIDYVKIFDGGDGGRGGHIILRGDPQYWTLIHLKYRKHIKAEHGGAGSGGLRHGANGADIILDVPLGTVAKDAETGEVLCEIMEAGQQEILVRGGRGGKGNNFFKTATMQTPRFAQEGEPGKEGWFILELKLLADVGLVGFPNAGKSTLLLEPNLGIVSCRDDHSFVMADIPGIIEGAHEGKGLGLRFLKHIERNSMLLFVIPADSKDIRAEYRTLLGELEQFNPELLDKDRLLGISKADILDEELRAGLQKELPEGIPSIFFSSVSGENIPQLKDMLWNTLNTERP